MSEEIVDVAYKEEAPEVALAVKPEVGPEALLERYRAITTVMREGVMREGVDYGKIPGSKKNVLLKPGAEKLAALFGITIRVELTQSVEDWENGFFYYRYKAIAEKNGRVLAETEGSTNSRERRYANQIKKGRATPYDLVNTLQKMAQKRAIVGAVLLATGASEFFTQDLEDMEFLHEEEPRREAAAEPKTDGKVTPEQLKQIGKLLVKIDFGGKDERSKREARSLLSYIIGREMKDSYDLTYGEAQQIIDALSASEEAVTELVSGWANAEAEKARKEIPAITEGQRKKIMALFNNFGITDRGERLKYTAQLLGVKGIESTNDLTKAQAARLIEILEAKEEDGKKGA